MSADFFTCYTIIILIYVFYRCLLWFLEPFLVNYEDKSPVIRSYTFTDPSITNSETSFPFPSIKDDPTKAVSLIFPAYNEEKRIHACLDPTIKYLKSEEEKSKKNSKNKKNIFSWEIIVVNDGSTDKTCDIVKEYSKIYTADKIRLLSYKKNQGKGFAVQQGMLHARGCLILFADADGASEITHFKRLENALLQKLNQINIWDISNMDGIAIGSRSHLQKSAEVQRTFFRNLAMWGFHFFVKYVGNVSNLKDTQCGFKLFTRLTVKKTFLFQKIRRWCFDPELLMLAQKQNIPICEMPIKWEEVPGSKLSVLKATLTMLREMIIYRFCYIFGIWYSEMK